MNQELLIQRKNVLIAEHTRITAMVDQGQKTLSALVGAVQEINFWIEQTSPEHPASKLPDNVVDLEAMRPPRFRKTFTHEKPVEAPAPETSPTDADKS